MTSAKRKYIDLFSTDNYALRHATGHNMYDPECLITGREIARGFTYTNSHRDIVGPATYNLICGGELKTRTVLNMAPRLANS